MNFVKHMIIKKLSPKLVSRLRLYRERRDSYRAVIYKYFFKFKEYEPYYLKFYAEEISVQKMEKNHDDVSKQVCWGYAFSEYALLDRENTVDLVWADGPIPGNYGDWLSPYIISRLAAAKISYINQVSKKQRSHIVGIGSIMSCVNEYSCVVGAGISHVDQVFDVRADFRSVRGPYTAERLRKLGGRSVETFGDLGFALANIYQPNSMVNREDTLVVRHINHAGIPLLLKPGFREISIDAAHPGDIESFIDQLHTAALVATSAMHCFITCLSYGIPCILFDLGEGQSKVPGDGIKYRDTLAGVGLPEISPLKITNAAHFCEQIADTEPYQYLLPDHVKHQIEVAAKDAFEVYSTKPRKRR